MLRPESTADLSRAVDAGNPNCIITPESERDISHIDSTSTATPHLSERPFTFCFPPELLAAIFLECAQLSRGAFSYRTTTVPSWVAVSYICRYWRNVALGCAHLWAHLFLVSPEWTDELLRRSKTVPLVVHIDLSLFRDPASGTIRSLVKALENISRIEDLRINCPSKSSVQILHSKMIASAPLLRSLYLSQEDGRHPFTIRKDMFLGAMPGLKKVHLELCFVDWTSPMFNGLAELTLHYILGDNWGGLLLILRQLPRLRWLTLVNVLSTADDISFINHEDVEGPISLPQLEKLTLTDPILWVTALLSQLEFPRSTIVQLQCGVNDPWTISRLLPLIMDRHSSPLPSAASAQVVFQYLDFYRYHNRLEVVYGTSSHPNAHGTSIFSLTEKHLGSQITSTCTRNEVDPDEILRWFRVFPLAHLNVITLASFEEDVDDEHLWDEVFRSTSELHTIQLECGYIERLILALHPRNGVIPVPTLTDIVFREIEFEGGECLDGQNHVIGKGDLMRLCSALASRVEAGNVLQRLGFSACTGITKKDMTELSKVVGQLSVGGQTRSAEKVNTG